MADPVGWGGPVREVPVASATPRVRLRLSPHGGVRCLPFRPLPFPLFVANAH